MDDLEIFLGRHKNTSFPNSEILFADLESENCFFKSRPQDAQSSLPCKHCLDIYTSRLEHLRQFGTPHARKLRDDIALMCEELAKSPEEHVRVWFFHKEPNLSFTIFESVESQRILGCLLAADQTRTNDNEWHDLWHRAEN